MRKRLAVMALVTVFVALAYTARAGEGTLRGRFNWSRRGPQKHDLSVKITPKQGAKNEWTAVYNFKWGGKSESWKGTMKLDPQTGKLTGTGVKGRRNFVFRGTLKQGKMTDGKTFEIKNGREVATGDLELDATSG